MIESIIARLVEKEKLEEFAQELKQNGYKKGIVGFLEDCFFHGALLALFALTALLLTKTNGLYIILFCFVAFFSPFLAKYFFHSFKFERDRRKKEFLVPDVLLQASVFPRSTPMQKIIKYIANADYGLLSREFELAFFELKKGASVESALFGIKARCNSRIIDRAMNLLLLGYRSGADLSESFKGAAEDILETQSILRERQATMVVEKYTLLFAGGLIVPAILGLLVGLVKGMNFSAIGLLGIGLSAIERKALLDAAMLGSQLYIAEYALIASFFIAQQEGSGKKGILYALFLLPLSFAAFVVAKG